jgi:pyroglutamyl-peptidase
VALTALIGGFGRFPGAPFNPTTQIVDRLAKRSRPALADVHRVAHVFRTSYAVVDRELPALIACHQPDIVLLFGLAKRAIALRIETRAANRCAVQYPDVDGYVPADPAIDVHGPEFLLSRAPHGRLVSAASSAGLPARLSHDAGNYVCNYCYWRALEAGERCGITPIVQFVHVPNLSTGTRLAHVQDTKGSRRDATLADVVRAAEAILIMLVTTVRADRLRRRAVDSKIESVLRF